MVPIKSLDRRRVRSNFAAHASDYDQYANVQKHVAHRLAEEFSDYQLQEGPILDIGTGTGLLAAELSSRFSHQAILVMDHAHSMTRTALHRLPSAWACDGDARHLPIAKEALAAVVSSSVYQWVESLPTAFSDVARVLKPDGLFAVALFGEQTLHELRSSHRAAVSSCGQMRLSHAQSFPTLDEVSEALGGSGLTVERLQSWMEIEYHQDVPQLLRRLKQIGAANAAVDRPRGLASRQIVEGMIRSYEERHRTEKGVPASYEVLLAIARKGG